MQQSVGFEHSSTAAAAKFQLCFLPSGRVTLGDVGSRSECHSPCQGVLRTPTGSPQAASLSTSFSSHSHPFPWASLTHLGPARPVSPDNSPSPALKPEVRAASPGAQDACASPRGSEAGASRWAPGPRALPGCGARLFGISSPGGLRGFRARDSAGCEWAPGEALKEEVVDLGTPGPP